LTLDRKVRADGGADGEPGGLVISSAGDMTINKEIDARSGNTDADGGTIELESGTGNIFVNGNLTASGGGASGGGEICIITGEDLVVNSPIDASGGDFDGGIIEIDAGRDALINHDLNVNAGSGEGFGGEIALLAGRDAVFTGTSAHTSNGSQSVELFGGDGGSQDYFAGRDIVVNSSVNYQAKGAAPDGYGETISFGADGALTMNGDITAISDGGLGGGGGIELTSEGDMSIGSTASLDVSGGSGGGGDVDIFGSANITLAGSITSTGGNGGYGGAVLLDCGALLEVTGSVQVGGTAFDTINGSVDIDSCNTNLRGTSVINNQGNYGDNTITSRERLTLFSGAQMLASTATGSNTIIYRSAAKAPVINGIVTPSADLVLSEGLLGCPVCGNSELEQGESCDDGNQVGGDGCSADCQDENCIAMTPGYPAVPLCNDDDGCTVDTCDNGVCVNTLSCDDGIDCTIDSCDGVGACINAPTASLCDDDNICTTDTCSAQNGCFHSFVNASCDDGVACTSNDVCMGGECSGVSNCPGGQFCNSANGMCVNTTTTTTMPSLCGNGSVTPPETCDDGDTFWSQGEYCDSNCNQLACGDTDDTTSVSATDALYVLRVAVGLDSCDACICDVDNSGAVTSGDALRLLRNAVGISVELLCPTCPN
jgi:cysteine-rich repeat protein